MNNFVSVLKAIIAILPLVVEAIKAIEAALPIGVQGESKLGVIRAMIEASYAAATDSEVGFDRLWPALERVIGALVGLFNKAGAFR